jgi:hypothetical protein
MLAKVLGGCHNKFTFRIKTDQRQKWNVWFIEKENMEWPQSNASVKYGIPVHIRGARNPIKGKPPAA